MGYTDWMRKHTGLAAAAVLSACMLFGCTRADIASTAGGAADQNTAQSTGGSDAGAGTLAGGGTANGKDSTAQAAQSTQASAASSASASSSAGQAQPAAQNVSGTTTQNASSAQAGSTTQTGTSTQTGASTQTGTSVQAGNSVQTGNSVQGGNSAQGGNSTQGGTAAQAGQNAAPAQNVTPAQNASPAQNAVPASSQNGGDASDDSAAETVTQTVSGEYEKNDGSESVVISLVDSNQISFQFRESGIGATCQAGGNTAVYYGDDGFTITFEASGDALSVTVNGEGGETSPVNGVYYRVLDDASGSGGAAADDDLDDADYSYAG